MENEKVVIVSDMYPKKADITERICGIRLKTAYDLDFRRILSKEKSGILRAHYGLCPQTAAGFNMQDILNRELKKGNLKCSGRGFTIDETNRTNQINHLIYSK